MTARRLLALTTLAVMCSGQQPAKAPLYEIRGTVVDHLTNRPINKALVRLTPITGPGQLTSLTGDDGRFGFVNIPKGKYRMAAQRRGYFPHAFHENGQYSTAVVVGPGLDATNIVFPLQATASITGTVLDEDGAPMPSVNVLEYRDMVAEGEKRVVQMGNFQTDSSGRFHFGQLSAGAYFVAVQASNWQAGDNVVYPVTFNGDTTDAHALQPIVVNEGENAQIQIALHPAANIHIPIGDFRPERGVRTPQLFVRGPGDSLIPAGNMTGDSRGLSEITGLAAGRYAMRVFGGRLPSATRDVDVADGVPLAISSAAPGPSISGTVTFEGGSRPPSATSLMFSETDQWPSFQIAVQPDGTLAPDRQRVAPGAYLIRLASDEYYIKSMTVQGARLAADRIELTEDCHAKLSIVAAPTGTLFQLEGFALREGKPIAGAMVLLVPRDASRSPLYRRDQTDSDGSFGLPGIIPGSYTLVAIDDEGRGLVYKDPAVIRPYLAAGQSITFPRQSDAPVRITVQPRLR